MSKFTSNPDKFGKTSYSPSNSTAVQTACYIAGCLAAEDLLNVDFGNPFTEGRFSTTVRIIAEILIAVLPPGTDAFELPNELGVMPWRKSGSDSAESGGQTK